MTTPCGCTTPTPDTPVPANCNPIPPYAEPVIPDTSPCCMACVFDDLAANWIKPVGEATALLPVCDVTRFREDQCVAVVGTNGLGGVYKVDAVLTDSIQVVIHDGTTYDIGGAGTVQGGRLYLLPTCPLTQAQVISLISGAIPSEYALAVHSSSDTTHGFSLAVVSNQIKLVYDQANLESQIATYLNAMGVTLFKPVSNTTVVTLFSTEAAATGTLDIAADFSVTIPGAATHAKLLIDFFVMASDGDTPTPGDETVMYGDLEFAGSAQYKLSRGSQNITAAVQSTEGFARRDLGSLSQVVLDVPMTAGEIDWEYTRTIWKPTGAASAVADAEATVRLLGFLITP